MTAGQPWPTVTAFDPTSHVYEALRAGASGFVLMDIPPEDLVTAVRTVADGGALLAASITRRLIGQFAAPRSIDVSLRQRISPTAVARATSVGGLDRGVECPAALQTQRQPACFDAG